MLSKESLNKTLEKISNAARESGRKATDVKLVVVTKTWPVDVVKKCAELGIKSFGENYVQEAILKQDELTHLNLDWHFVGSLQSKKIKDLVGRFSLIHSLDRLKVAEEISKRSLKDQGVLLQINIGREESKSGLLLENAKEAIEKIQQLPKVMLKGLMFMPPLSGGSGESSLRFFEDGKKAQETLSKYVDGPHSLKELSMGTSQDFEYAIKAGATIIRLGTVILGERT